MPVESASFISQLNPSYPDGSNVKSEGDDHIRLVKTTLQGSFPNIGAAAVTMTAAELNTVTARALKAGDTYTGTHDFTGGNPLVPTATLGDNSTKAASTAFVQAAIANVNAVAGVTASSSAATSFSVSEGEVVAASASGAVAVTFPATPSAVGVICGVIFDNGRTDNTVDLGSNGIRHNGVTISGVITNGARVPFYLRWYGDYWRFI